MKKKSYVLFCHLWLGWWSYDQSASIDIQIDIILLHFVFEKIQVLFSNVTRKRFFFFGLHPANRRAPETFVSSRMGTLKKKIRRVSSIALAISSSGDSERNIDGLQDFRMGESADGKEIEVYSDSDFE